MGIENETKREKNRKGRYRKQMKKVREREIYSLRTIE
jgi:hypothetical protein